MRRIARFSVAASVFALCMNGVGISQSVPLKTSDLPSEMVAQKNQSALFDPTQDSVASSPATQLSIEGSKDSATGKAQVGLQFHDFLFGVKGSVPITKDDDQKDIADLDGLANKATADFGVSYLNWNPKADPQLERQICINYFEEEFQKDAVQHGQEAQAAVDSGKEKTVAEALAAIHDKAKQSVLQNCSIMKLPADSKYRAQYIEAVDWGTPLIATVRYKFSKEQFKYVLPNTYANQTDSHVSYSATAALGVVTHTAGLIQLDYLYQSSWEGQDSSNLCAPAATGSTSTICRDVTIGGPDRTIKNILQLEAHTFIGKSFGLAPVIAGDLRGKVASISVPMYVFKSKSGGLNGGVNLKWKSDTNAFSASVFIGDVLTLLSKN